MTGGLLRVLHSSANGELTVASSTHVETLRPKSTIRKQHVADAVFGPGSATADVHETIAPRVRAAVAGGRSAYILSLGAEQSGKSTSVRASEDGLALNVAKDVFDSMPPTAEVESLVTVSAIGCAIVPATGTTAFTGKKVDVREVLIDLLDDLLDVVLVFQLTCARRPPGHAPAPSPWRDCCPLAAAARYRAPPRSQR